METAVKVWSGRVDILQFCIVQLLPEFARRSERGKVKILITNLLPDPIHSIQSAEIPRCSLVAHLKRSSKQEYFKNATTLSWKDLGKGIVTLCPAQAEILQRVEVPRGDSL